MIEQEPPTEEFPEGRELETVIEPNTNERAVVRILVPTKKVLASEIVDEAIKPSPRGSPDLGESPNKAGEKDGEKPEDGEEGERKEDDLGEEKKDDELVDIEEEQNDMALSVANRVSIAPAYSVYIMNQYAQRSHR